MRVLACLDAVPAADGTCAQAVFVDQPSLLPTLTAEQGAELGFQLLATYVMVRLAVMLREAIRDRI